MRKSDSYVESLPPIEWFIDQISQSSIRIEIMNKDNLIRHLLIAIIFIVKSCLLIYLYLDQKEYNQEFSKYFSSNLFQM